MSDNLLIALITFCLSDSFFKSIPLKVESLLLKTVDIRSPKTVISVHFSYSLPMAMQIY